MITSTSNPAIKSIHKLRERKERQTTGLYYLEGIRIVAEALLQNIPLKKILIAPDLLTSDFALQLVNDAKIKQMEVVEVSAGVFNYLSPKEGPQGIAAVAEQVWQSLDNVRLKQGDLWVALREVADPGNLGTILRTADATGCRGVILVDHCTDPYDLSAIRASMGALFSLQLIRCNFNEFQGWVEKCDYSVVGTSDHAEMDYHSMEYPDPMILMVGSEREGLTDEFFSVCEGSVKIPMAGKSDSLNLAVATGVVLYEIFNQRRGATDVIEREKI
jgi:TrmH family RNA methyltransferase